jgi:glycosyltransferase involved in cell wall biosynthesis
MANKKRIKFGVLLNSFQIGGSELQVLQLLENINRDKFEPIVFTEKVPGSLSYRIIDQGIKLIPLNIDKHDFTGSLTNFYNVLKFHKIDILYCLLYSSILIGSIVGKLAGVRYIVGGIRGLGMTWSRKQILGLRLVKYLVDAFIVNSEAIKRVHASRKCLPISKVHVIPNGLDLSLFRYEPEKEDIISIVGSLKPIKGQTQFIKAAGILLEKYIATTFMIVGDGPDKAKLEKLVYDLGIRERVIFTGYVDNVYDYIRRSKLLISASAFEGCSNSILEAMAIGTPVIASDVPSNNELIENMKNGLLYKFGDEEDLVSKINYLISHPRLYETIQQNARNKVEHSFTLSKMVCSTEKCFLNLISK